MEVILSQIRMNIHKNNTKSCLNKRMKKRKKSIKRNYKCKQS